MKIQFLLWIGCILWAFHLPAQSNQRGEFKGSFSGSISGVVQDASSTPLAYAAVSIFSLRDSSVADGQLSDEKGKFKLAVNRPGKYIVKIQSIGFLPFSSPVLMINPEQADVSGLVYTLKTSVKKLQEVEVEANRSGFIQQADRKVFLVDKNMVSTGGSATDVLQQVPMVNVDAEGNISMRGDENITILIDGRPTLVNAANRTQFLQSIPAASIDRIELITNPSARFDAEGSPGMINIVLKKNRKQALNGSASAFWATTTKAGGSFNLGFKEKKAGFSMNYSARYFPVWNSGFGYSLNNINDSAVLVSQGNRGENRPLNHQLKLNLDLTPGKGWSAYLNATGGTRQRYEMDQNDYLYLPFDSTLRQDRYRLSIGQQNSWSIESSAGWEKKIGKSHKLNMDVSWAWSPETNDLAIADLNLFKIGAQESMSASNFKNSRSELNNSGFGKMDYEWLIKDKIKLEAGIKYGFRNPEGSFRIDTSSGSGWAEDRRYTRDFSYTEHIAAQYVNFTGTWKSFTAQAGLRAEQAFIRARQSGDEAVDFKRQFLQAFPTLFISWSPRQEHSLGLNYSMRVNRPFVNSLLPLPDIADPQNIRRGNPELIPELVHNMELSYTYSKKQQFVNITGYYRIRLNQLNRFRSVDAEGNGFVTWVNYDRSDGFGGELSARAEILKNWDAFINLNLYGTRIIGGEATGNLNNSGLSFMMKANTSYKFPKIFTLQTSVFYQAPQPTAQGRIGYFLAWDAALKAEAVKGKFFITLSAQDMLKTRKFEIKTSSANFRQSGQRWRENRILTLNLQYNFGKQNQQGKRRNRPEGEGPGMDDF